MDRISLLLYVILTLQPISCVELKFTPSSPIALHEKAIYECRVTDVDEQDTVGIRWNINGYRSSAPADGYMDYINEHGIIVNNPGEQESNVIMPGNASLNGSNITCIASGHITDMPDYWNESSAILYIQGKPVISEFNCTSSTNATIECTWTEPYTLVDITNYKLNITFSKTPYLLPSDATSYTVQVDAFGTYTVWIAAWIGELEGEVISTQILISNESTSDITSYPPQLSTMNPTSPDPPSSTMVPTTMISTTSTISTSGNITSSGMLSSTSETPSTPPSSETCCSTAEIIGIIVGVLVAIAIVTALSIMVVFILIRWGKCKTKNLEKLTDPSQHVELSSKQIAYS